MLRELHIKNVAVIDEIRVDFNTGFNVLTGETGAGKSILIDSINMALGQRASHDLIRSGCDFALADLCFEVDDKNVIATLEDLGVEVEDGLVALSRKLTADGKSVCRINGSIVPAGVVREIAPLLIDIHGQNDNQSLLSPKNHLGFLDSFGGLLDDVQKYRTEYTKMKHIMEQIEALNVDNDEKARRLDMLNFQIDEINAANLKIGEDDELVEKRERLLNIENIVSGAGTAYGALYGDEAGTAFDMLKSAKKAISDLCAFDSRLDASYSRLEEVIAEVEDIASDINSCLFGTEFSPAELDRIEERLDLYNKLKRKYGSTVEEILKFRDDAVSDAQQIEKSDEELEKLQAEYRDALKVVAVLAEGLSKSRKTAATALEKAIVDELVDLDMPKVRFAARFATPKVDEDITYTQTGKDSMEFMISTNPGEDLKPMAKIASGGELSRIMLAIKTVLQADGGADTMIFDEIDTGVSGRAAQKIGEKLWSLAKSRQVFSITHLAQIASMADCHYLIEKTSQGDVTRTGVALLNEDMRTKELARIIGGARITDLTCESATEMLTLANEKKGIL